MNGDVDGSGRRPAGRAWFEVRVRGTIRPAVLSALGDAVVAWGQLDDEGTVVTLRAVDDPQLRGLLEELLGSGAQLLDVRPLPEAARPTAADSAGGDVDGRGRGRGPAGGSGC